MDAGSDHSSAAKLWSVALLCWLSFLHVLLPHLVYKVLHLCFTKGWFRGLRYVTWSTVLSQLFTCCSHAVHMHFTCWSHVGHMLVTSCFVFLCANCVHLATLCIRTASVPVHVRPCFHSCSSHVGTLYTLAPPCLLTYASMCAGHPEDLPPHLRSMWCTLYTKEASKHLML